MLRKGEPTKESSLKSAFCNMHIGIGYILPTVWGKYISWMYVLVLDILITSYREIFERRKKIVASDTKGGGKGVRAEKKTQTDFKKCFFILQKPYKIIIGPPKHVLHLVWSVWAHGHI